MTSPSCNNCYWKEQCKKTGDLMPFEECEHFYPADAESQEEMLENEVLRRNDGYDWPGEPMERAGYMVFSTL